MECGVVEWWSVEWCGYVEKWEVFLSSGTCFDLIEWDLL